MSQSSPITPLASAKVNHDRIAIELIESLEAPAVVRVVWPTQPSIVDPKRFSDTANTVATLFARAHVVLAALKAGKYL